MPCWWRRSSPSTPRTPAAGISGRPACSRASSTRRPGGSPIWPASPGAPRRAEVFRAARVVVVAYSGGYQPAAFVLERGGDPGRFGGVILLDALYGHEDKFAQWIAAQRSSAFLAGIFTESTRENLQRLR